MKSSGRNPKSPPSEKKHNPKSPPSDKFAPNMHTTVILERGAWKECEGPWGTSGSLRGRSLVSEPEGTGGKGLCGV